MTEPAPATLCPGCLNTLGTDNPCPQCGYDETAPRSAILLPHRTLLNGQFIVGRVLGNPGRFGITYLGWDQNLETRVAIKEYLPRELAGRGSDHVSVAPHSRDTSELFQFGREQFLFEARTLAQLDHPNIMRVRQLFQANGTAYLVMDYYQGLSLALYLEEQGGRLPEDRAKQLLLPILAGLRTVHAKGLLHHDITPRTIYLARLDSGGVRPILIDFGAARYALGERRRTLSAIISPGYAPIEQYRDQGIPGPWTDIYAVAAVLYHLVTGSQPPAATARRDQDPLQPATAYGVSLTLSQAIEEALSLTPERRPQTVQHFQARLAGATVAPSQPTPSAAPIAIARPESFQPTPSAAPIAIARPESSQPTPSAAPIASSRPESTPAPMTPPRPRSRARITWLVVVGVLGIGGGAAWWERTRQAHQERDQRDTAAYTAARGGDTVGQYRAYLDACAADGCGHQGEAEQRLAELHADQQRAQEQARRDRDAAAYAGARREDAAPAYRRYLEHCAADGCGHQSEAQAALGELARRPVQRDDAEYAKAQSTDTSDGYFAYLNACAANGCGHEAEANQRLASLLTTAFDRGVAKLQVAADQHPPEANRRLAGLAAPHEAQPATEARKAAAPQETAETSKSAEARKVAEPLETAETRKSAETRKAAKPSETAETRKSAGAPTAAEVRKAAEAQKVAEAAEARKAEERRRQAPVAKVRAYFDAVRAQQVTAALACLNAPGNGTRAVIEKTRSVKIKELRLKDINETTAKVWIDWTGATRDGKQERWRGLVPLRWNGTDWKIETFKQLEQPDEPVKGSTKESTKESATEQRAAARGKGDARAGRPPDGHTAALDD